MMRRYFVLVLAILLGTMTLVSAQEDDQRQANDSDGIPLEVAPSHMISGQLQPVELEVIDDPGLLREPDAPPAADLCVGSPNLLLFPSDGSQTITNHMTQSSNDPALACAWNKSSDFTGYRTVWYRFTAVANGWVSIETAGSTYDTILSVYVGSCGTKVQIACNDDFVGFTSRVNFPVSTGFTYYIEAADWQFGVSGDATLNLAAVLTTANRWEEVSGMDVPRSRHASVISGNQIYVIGGQTTVSNTPVRTPHTSRFSTRSEQWTTLSNLPGDDGLGYSNTAAALVDGKIYVPSGYIGVDGLYDGTHWAYDIASNHWSMAVANNWANGEPAIYSTAQSYSSPSTPSGYFLLGGLTGPLPLPPSEPPTPWRPRGEMYYFVPSLNLWFQRAPMQTPRFGHTSALQRFGALDYLCTVGGIGSESGGSPIVLSQGECYNINTDQWEFTTGPLNYPRYFAASGVDRNGTWYVYGGVNHLGQNVPVTEIYDRQRNQWIALDSRSSLGSINNLVSPPRAWPRAGFVNQTLYAIGGERTTTTGGDVINLVEAIYLPDLDVLLPIVSNRDSTGEPDDTLENARAAPLNRSIQGLFLAPDDYFDAYFFDVPSFRGVTVSLRNIPLGSDYDLHVYTSDKVWMGSSTNVGNNNEDLPLTLEAGRYYFMVERVFPLPGIDPSHVPYVVKVSG
jgi:hypothetical protein